MKEKTMPYKIIIDFDGTVCKHKFPNTGEPYEDVRESLQRFLDAGYAVHIQSVRFNRSLWGDTAVNRHIETVKKYMEDNKLPYTAIDSDVEKTLAVAYLDDRGYNINSENWKEVTDNLLNHETTVANITEDVRVKKKINDILSIKADIGDRDLLKKIMKVTGWKPEPCDGPSEREAESPKPTEDEVTQKQKDNFKKILKLAEDNDYEIRFFDDILRNKYIFVGYKHNGITHEGCNIDVPYDVMTGLINSLTKEEQMELKVNEIATKQRELNVVVKNKMIAVLKLLKKKEA